MKVNTGLPLETQLQRLKRLQISAAAQQSPEILLSLLERKDQKHGETHHVGWSLPFAAGKWHRVNCASYYCLWVQFGANWKDPGSTGGSSEPSEGQRFELIFFGPHKIFRFLSIYKHRIEVDSSVVCCSSFNHGWIGTVRRARKFFLFYFFSDCVFLKRWVLFVFIWWQLNNPVVREFGGVFIDMILFFGRCYWIGGSQWN